jgi:hypothetical protein
MMQDNSCFFQEHVWMKTRCAAIVLIIALWLSPALALAQEPAAVKLSAQAGLDGYYRIGQWLPLRVQLENSGAAIDGRVEVVLPRPDGGHLTYRYPLSLPTQSRKEITLYLSPHQYANRLQVAFLDQAGQMIAKQEQALKAVDTNDRLYGIIADQPSAFNVLSEIDPPQGNALSAQLTAHKLPDRSAALDTLDALIISNVDTGAMTEAQRNALSAWVANGGRLIVTGGADWQKTSAGLSDLLPLHPTGTTTLSEAPSLTAFANIPIDPGSLIIATGNMQGDAQSVVTEAGTPLITQRTHGYGEVYFLGFDPAAFAQWDGLSPIFRQLLAADIKKPNWSYGVQDWSTAASAAAMIPNLNLPPVTLICGFVVLYMIALGPVNFLIVRALKRRELAWITAPLLAVGFLLGAFLFGTITRGSDPVISRLALIEVWPSSDRARVTGIVGLYAPQRAAYEVTAERGVLLHPPLNDQPYGTSDTTDWTLINNGDIQRARVEMDVSEVKTLSASGDIPAPSFDVNTQIVVDSSGARAVGTVRNNGDVTLEDAVLVGPGQAIELGAFKPGDSIPVNFPLAQAARSADIVNSAPYYNYNDTTLQDIAGSYYYGNPDRVRARRYEMLSALLRGNSSYRPRGDGFYLAGWNEQSPLAVEVAGSSFGAYDTSLYVVDLNPDLHVMSDTLTLSPGLFTWKSDESNGPSIAPYDTEVYPGTHIVQFNLARPVAYESVEELILHLDGSGAAQNAITVALWDYRLKDWTQLPNLKVGDNSIIDPARHVGPGGEIRVKLEAVANSYPHLDRLDFTLKVR